MKKLYTLLFVAIAAFTVNAQTTTTETFDNLDTTVNGSNYGDGNFTGAGGIVWTYAQARSTNTITDEGPYEITGRGIILRRPISSYLEATFPNGLSQFSFQYRKAFTGGTARQVEVLVNGVVAATGQEFGAGTGESTTVLTQTLTINQAGPVTIRIKNVGDLDQNRQFTIDNVTWAPAATNGLAENNIAGLSIYPNPVSGGILNITTEANATKAVAIYDVVGKMVVNTVTENGTVNVSNLSTGVYVVKVTEEGKTATKKLVVR